MRANSLALAITVLFASVASGQTPPEPGISKVFHFANTETEIGFQELTNAIRAIAQIPQASFVPGSKALAVRGTSGQAEIAEWLFRALDKPAGVQSPAKLESAVPNAANDLVRVFYTANTGTPQSLQEIVNAIRSITEIRYVSVCNGPNAIAIRGTAAQVALADWLLQGLDRPAGGGPFTTISQTLNAPELRSRDGSPMVARILYPAYIATPQHLQEAVNMIRSIAEAQRVVAIGAVRAIVVRGEPDQVALAEWLVNALAIPTTAEGPAMKPPRPGLDALVTRVFYLKHTSTPLAFQEIANTVRSKAKIMRLTVYNPAGAIALRGTPVEVAAAARLIQEADQPNAR
jgi:hypothetical protein